MRIKKNDQVIVIAGKDKGVTGTVTRALPQEGKVVVSGVNTRSKHQKSRRRGDKGEVIKFDAPIAVSNVSLIDPQSQKPTRVGYQVNKEGKKVRVSKKSGKEL